MKTRLRRIVLPAIGGLATGLCAIAAADLKWQVRNAPARTGDLSSAVYGNGMFVVGGIGEILSSNDGVNWVSYGTGTGDYLQSAAFGAGRFVLLGGGNSFTSTNGTDWSLTTVFTNNYFSAVTYGAGKFVALAGGTIDVLPFPPSLAAISEDGVTWSLSTLTNIDVLFGVTYGAGQFVAVGTGGAIFTSPDGANWSRQYPENGVELQAVTYGNGKFAAVGWYRDTNGMVIDKLLTSIDGVNWTNATFPTHYGYEGVAFGSGRFVAVGGGFASSSVDGLQWQSTLVLPVTGLFNGVCYGNSSFVAVGSSASIAQATVLGISIGPSPDFGLLVTGPSGKTVNVEWSGAAASAAGWSLLESVSLTNGAVQVIDSSAGMSEARFYRALLP